MSASKKRRELNRAAEEHRRAALKAGHVQHMEFLSNLAESMVVKELEKVTAQRDELLAALKLAREALKDIAEVCDVTPVLVYQRMEAIAREALTTIDAALKGPP